MNEQIAKQFKMDACTIIMIITVDLLMYQNSLEIERSLQ